MQTAVDFNFHHVQEEKNKSEEENRNKRTHLPIASQNTLAPLHLELCKSNKEMISLFLKLIGFISFILRNMASYSSEYTLCLIT